MERAKPSTNAQKSPIRKARPGHPEASCSIAMVSSEVVPFAKTGGLADAVCALSKALEGLGQRLTIILPAHRSAKHANVPLERIDTRFHVPLGGRRLEAGVWKAQLSGHLRALLIEAEPYFDRDDLYGTPEGDYPDNAERFAFFSRAALEVLRHEPPQILHAHDWHPALSLASLKAGAESYPEFSQTKTVLTIHNLGYQGIFPENCWPLLGLDQKWFHPEFLEFHGRVNFLKGGLMFADKIATVSKTYAKEIQTPEYGFGLEGVLQKRASDLEGILNGADYDVWDPSDDHNIKASYGIKDLSGKLACKADLQETLGLPKAPDVPLVGMVSRLAEQKGIGLLLETLEPLAKKALQVAIVGKGEASYEQALSAFQAAHDNVKVCIAFDEALAHKVLAGADFVLIPSRYEPCGLVQMHAMRYGTPPIARATGGLKDTIVPYEPGSKKATGFLFEGYDVPSLLGAIDTALAVYKKKATWRVMMKNAMKADFSWKKTAESYLEIYKSLLIA